MDPSFSIMVYGGHYFTLPYPLEKFGSPMPAIKYNYHFTINLVSLIEFGQNLSVGSFGAQNYFHVIQVNEVVEKYWREFGYISHAVIGHNHYIDIAVQFMSIDVIIDVIENVIDLF